MTGDGKTNMVRRQYFCSHDSGNLMMVNSDGSWLITVKAHGCGWFMMVDGEWFLTGCLLISDDGW